MGKSLFFTSNLGLCVNPDFEYVKIKCIDGYTYILAKELVESVLSCVESEEGQKKYEILETFKGSDLVGMKYEPLYPYAIDIINKQKKKAFIVYNNGNPSTLIFDFNEGFSSNNLQSNDQYFNGVTSDYYRNKFFYNKNDAYKIMVQRGLRHRDWVPVLALIFTGCLIR